MKNFKKLLIGMFAALSLTEVSCPIILTGPVRRQAHRKEKEAQEIEQEIEQEMLAYSIGEHQEQKNNEESNNQNSNENYEESQEVSTQSLDDQNEYSLDQNGQDLLIDESDEQTFNANNYAEENYADDAVVQIQSFGDGSRLSKLTPEQQEFIKGRLLEKMHNKNNGNNSGDENNSNNQDSQNVQTQSIDNEDNLDFDNENNDEESMQDNDYAMIQALTEQDEQAPAKPNDKLSAQKIVQTEHQVQADLAQAAQAATNLVQVAEREEQVELPAEPVEISIEQTVAAQPELLNEEPAQPAVQSPVVEQPAQPTAAEPIIKIVKVYPVYDAVLSAVASVKAAAYDMINYAYSFIVRK